MNYKFITKLFIFLAAFFAFFSITENAYATVYFSDQFDVSSHTELSLHTPDVGTGWTRIINNSRALYVYSYNDHVTTQSNGDNVGALYTADATYSSADYKITGRIAFAPGDSNYTRSFAVRVQDANNMYLARFGSGASGITIYKRVAGTWTSLGSTSYTPTGDISAPYNDAGDIIGLQAQGTSISALVNGTAVLTVTDSSISAAGKAGLGTGYVNVSTDDSGTGVGIDDVVVEDVDITNPVLSSFFPADNATGVTTTANFIITFNEAVDAESGNITIYKASDDSQVEVIDVTSGQVTGSGSASITVNPSVTLDEETEYYIQIDATAFDDTSGNSYAGISDETTWSFTTGDFTNPTASSLSPIDNAASVSIDSNLTITFTEAVDAESGNITLYKASDDSVVEVFDVTSDISGSGTTIITINPSSDLSYETEYYIQIDATAFDDASGNSYVGISDETTWSFTTANTPVCASVENAATYNSYPTCGAATCNQGYNLVNGACVAIGGSVMMPPSSSGSGEEILIVDIKEVVDIKNVIKKTFNILLHIWSQVNFNLQLSNEKDASSHSVYIKDLDLSTKKIKAIFQSEPIEVDFNLNEAKDLDLNKDGVNDLRVEFIDLVVNRIELAITNLTSENVDIIWKEVEIKEEKNEISESVISYQFRNDLRLGLNKEDVRELQKYLNTKGFLVAKDGYGSPGNETTYFGELTKKALIEFQKANNISPAFGYFGPKTRSFINQ